MLPWILSPGPKVYWPAGIARFGAGGVPSFRVGRFKQEVENAQAESEVAGAGLGVDERAGGDARDVPRGGDRGTVAAGFDFDPATGRVGAAGGKREHLASLVLDVN